MHCFLEELLVCLSPGVEGGKGVSSLQQPLSAQLWTVISPASLAWPGALTVCYLQEQEQAPTPWRRALLAAPAHSAAPQAVSGNSAAETSPDVERLLSCSKNPSLCPKDLPLPWIWPSPHFSLVSLTLDHKVSVLPFELPAPLFPWDSSFAIKMFCSGLSHQAVCTLIPQNKDKAGQIWGRDTTQKQPP